MEEEQQDQQEEQQEQQQRLLKRRRVEGDFDALFSAPILINDYYGGGDGDPFSPAPIGSFLVPPAPAVPPQQQPSPQQQQSTTVPFQQQLEEIPQLLCVDIQQQSSDSDAVLKGLERLRDLFYGEENTNEAAEKYLQNRKTALEMDGIGLLLVVLRKWTNSEAIQAVGFACLANLLSAGIAGSNQDTAVEAKVAKLGGIQLALQAMKRFPNSLQVNQAAIQTLAGCLTDAFAPRAIQFVSVYNGIATVVAAMKQHKSSDVLVSTACGLFLNLSFNEDFVDAMDVADAFAMSALEDQAAGGADAGCEGCPGCKPAAGPPPAMIAGRFNRLPICFADPKDNLSCMPCSPAK